MYLTRAVCAVIQLATKQNIHPTFSFILGAVNIVLNQEIKPDMLETVLYNLVNADIIEKHANYYVHIKLELFCGSLK